ESRSRDGPTALGPEPAIAACFVRSALSSARLCSNSVAAALIRRLTADDAEAYRALMLEAYRLEPEAFTSTERERAGLPAAWWIARISDPAGLKVGFGACMESAMAGAVALKFETKERTKHKASLIGMYVRPGARGRGIGRALIAAALEHAGSRAGTTVV